MRASRRKCPICKNRVYVSISTGKFIPHYANRGTILDCEGTGHVPAERPARKARVKRRTVTQLREDIAAVVVRLEDGRVDDALCMARVLVSAEQVERAREEYLQEQRESNHV